MQGYTHCYIDLGEAGIDWKMTLHLNSTAKPHRVAVWRHDLIILWRRGVTGIELYQEHKTDLKGYLCRSEHLVILVACLPVYTANEILTNAISRARARVS